MAVIDLTLTLAPSDTTSLTALGHRHDSLGRSYGQRPSDGRRAAEQHLARARRAVTALGSDGNHLWTAFGPTNVTIHEVAVAAELGDYQRAAALGEQVDASLMPMER